MVRFQLGKECEKKRGAVDDFENFGLSNQKNRLFVYRNGKLGGGLGLGEFPTTLSLVCFSPTMFFFSSLCRIHQACSHLTVFAFSLPLATRFLSQIFTWVLFSVQLELCSHVTVSETIPTLLEITYSHFYYYLLVALTTFFFSRL